MSVTAGSPRGCSLRLGRECLRVVSQRWLSANEASVALRPFYFAVHPDRFATLPDVRAQNEKALQTFNGYLSDLYPRPSLSSHRPIQVTFSIFDKAAGANGLKEVSISLQGTDPINIVRTALESCKLSTEHIARSSSSPATSAAYPSSSSDADGYTMDQTATNLWGEYLKRKKRTHDVASILKKRRDEALLKAKQHAKTHLTLKEEIEDIKWRTGCKDVVWQMDWAESHMRRCLTSLHRMLDHSSKADREAFVHILLKNTIRFGRGSFICCDGSVQFGADNVPEQWQNVCSEAAVRRNQSGQLEETRRQLSELLGGAEILCPPGNGLAQTLQQLQTLVTRIGSRPAEQRLRIARIAGETMVEVVTSYDELSVGQDGRLFVPCNVDIASLAAFLEEKATTSRRINADAQQTLAQLRRAKDTTISELRLADLDWEEALPMRAVLAAVERLRSAPQALCDNLLDLHVRFSANPTIHVRNDGKVSLPLDWS